MTKFKTTTPLDYDRLMRRAPLVCDHVWSVRDTILYNLGIGFGEAAITDPLLLGYTIEERSRAFPTMASTMGMLEGPWHDPLCHIDFEGILHGEESIEIRRPLTVAGRLIGSSRIVGIWDKGAERGAVMTIERTLSDPTSAEVVALVTSTIILRNSGGFGGTNIGAPKPQPLPSRPPDGQRAIPTRPEQALLYRLSGDTNPLHSDPETARRAGFERPILMGLCTFAIAGRALVSECSDSEGDRLRGLTVRFSGIVYPGETIRVEYWRIGDSEVAFRARAVERDSLVLSGGRATFAGA